MDGRDLIFEIGVEELPSGPLYSAIEQLRVKVPEALDSARLAYESVEIMASPRRIAVFVRLLSDRQSDSVLEAKGPSTSVAFDAAGAPTPAALGFARGKGVPVESLTVRTEGEASYVYAVVESKGSATLNVLPALLSSLVEGIDWPKSQRWGSGTARFSRPVRWLVALFGSEVVPVEFAGLVAGRTTRGHRFLAPEPVELTIATEYAYALERSKVVVDQNERARILRQGIDTAAASIGARAVVPDKTFSEVVNLVEWPTVVIGTFDEAFLEVPREILEHAMTKHQRYFPLERADGSLDNRFLVAHNGDPERTDSIVRGHERVIRARLADAAFFVHEDLRTTLEQWGAGLSSVVFQEKLGTLAEKVDRVERLAGKLGDSLGSGPDVVAQAVRAAHLCKADLVTNAVVEFTDLQGVMGRHYAIASGETPEVAAAIEDHYRPRFSGDALPSSEAGRLVSVADKADTICGIFAIGMAPKGTSDPFALRRSSIGILQMALDGTPLRLDELIRESLEGLSGAASFSANDVGAAVKTFFIGRLETILRDRGHAYDTVAAVLAVAGDDPADALARCEALTRFRVASDDMEDLSVAFTRARNLSKPELGVAVDVTIMGPEELTLATALDEAESAMAELMEQRAYSAILQGYSSLRGPIDTFFLNVMVMADDPAVRDNRLRLLNRFVALFESFADFGLLAG